MNYYVYFSEAASPKTGLTPTWETFADDGGSSTADNPPISEVGGGWYKFAIKYGDDTGPWKTTGGTCHKDLLGVIDGGAELTETDRYKPVCITLRGLALARLAHKASQAKSDGFITVFATDGVTEELVLNMTEDATSLTREPSRVG